MDLLLTRLSLNNLSVITQDVLDNEVFFGFLISIFISRKSLVYFYKEDFRGGIFFETITKMFHLAFCSQRSGVLEVVRKLSKFLSVWREITH